MVFHMNTNYSNRFFFSFFNIQFLQLSPVEGGHCSSNVHSSIPFLLAHLMTTFLEIGPVVPKTKIIKLIRLYGIFTILIKPNHG